MKDIIIKTEERKSVMEFIEDRLCQLSEMAIVFKLTPDDNDIDGISAKQQNINCSLFNIEPSRRYDFRVLVERTYYEQQVSVFEKKVADKDEQIMKANKVTDKMRKDLSDLKNILGWYEAFLNLYDVPEEGCRFASFIASAFTGSYISGVAVQPIIDALASEKNSDRHKKDTVNVMLHALSRTEDSFTKAYTINCNGKLLKDIEARYYKGRKAGKDGNVNRTFDKNGNLVRREIILAVVQYMQDKELFERECEEYSKDNEDKQDK